MGCTPQYLQSLLGSPGMGRGVGGHWRPPLLPLKARFAVYGIVLNIVSSSFLQEEGQGLWVEALLGLGREDLGDDL